MQSFYGILFFIGSAFSVPSDYCFLPLNQSDCRLKATPVFSYYKPGSRCEIYLWRGCPTMNKFDNEYDCSHLCIAKLGDKGSKEVVQNITAPVAVNPDPCTVLLNTTNCSNNETLVFTFLDGACIEAIWRGCPTQNKFRDEESCKKSCKQEQPINLSAWKTQLKGLDAEEVKDIDNILEDVIEEIQETTSEPTTAVSDTVTTMESEKSPTAEATTLAAPVETVTELPTVETTTISTIKPTVDIGSAEEVITT